MITVEVAELNPPVAALEGAVPKMIRTFTLSLNGVMVELCSVGASITKILLPKQEDNNAGGFDDVVLGYKSPLGMHESGNPPYFGAIVGRVANRIARGHFKLNNIDYNLAVNNGPNHLHGGIQCFSRRIWDMEIVDVLSRGEGKSQKGVKCTLLSPDGDEGYPGTILVTVIYTLLLEAAKESGKDVVSLRVDMKAQLQDDKPSPINLAQHSYFNLSRHNDPDGVLDHKVMLACESYTPTDATSIPTREVVALKDDPPMDLSKAQLVRDALKLYGMSKAGLDEAQSRIHLTALSRCGSGIAISGPGSPTPREPYGFDHNYVVSSNTTNDKSDLNLVGTIEHAKSKRRMKVFTNAPGVQVYSGNYLDGVNPDPKICKEGASYGQWQGICLETQHYPDSILSAEEATQFPGFAKGKCVILRPGAPDYDHTVQYSFEAME